MSSQRQTKKRGTLTDAYKTYPYKHLPKHPYYVNSTQFTNIVKDVNRKVADALILEGSSLELPHGLGEIRIKRRKSYRKKMIDFKKTKEFGFPVYHKNTHSNRFYIRWHWNKYIKHFKNRNISTFKPTRANARKAAHAVKYLNTIMKYPE